jgi:hypothetical protein
VLIPRASYVLLLRPEKSFSEAVDDLRPTPARISRLSIENKGGGTKNMDQDKPTAIPVLALL